MMYGGADISPANVGSFALGGMDLPAGRQFLDMHRAQHGGAADINLTGQPLIPSSMYDSARVAATYTQYGQIAGLSDQSGGRRRRRGRKGKKTHRRSRKMRGGSLALTPSPVDWQTQIKVPEGVHPMFKSWDASA